MNNGQSTLAYKNCDSRTMNNGQFHVEPRTRSLTGVQILGTGSYVPENVVTNLDLQESHGFDPEWIVNRTGIHERRFALPHQATSDLCTQAAIRCLKAAGCDPSDVDLLVARHVHARHVLPLDGKPGPGPAQAELPGLRHPGGLRGVHLRPDHRGAVRGGGDEQAGPGRSAATATAG